MSEPVLDRRALGRATLARQHLLARTDTPLLTVIEELVGLQAQEPRDPYAALWSRVEGFSPEDLERLLLDRAVVRIVMMRGTIHLVTAADCLGLRMLFQPVLDAELARHRDYAPELAGVDLAPVLAYAREVFAASPRTGPQLRAALAERFPKLHAAALAYACRNHLALVQVPPRGLWSRSATVTTTTAEVWLGRPVDPAPSIERMVERYLGAFGPATVADLAAWSRLTGLREVVDRVAPRLRRFRDEQGRELFDLPDAPRPDPDTPAPVRFLPEYDNVLLSHADRSRFLAEEHRAQLSSGPRAVQGTVLLDGGVCATWRTATDDDGAITLTADHPGRITQKAASSIRAEGRRFLKLLAPDAPTRTVDLAQLR